MEVRIVDTVSGQEDGYAERIVKLNSIGTVFIVENNDDINSVTNSISLHDVSNDGDNLKDGRCCNGISEVKTGVAVYSTNSNDDEETNQSYSCVTINARS